MALKAFAAEREDDVPDALRPVFDSLVASPSPRSTLRWLMEAEGYHLLVALSDTEMGFSLSHEGIDRWVASPSREFLRELLVAHRVLPERDEVLARLVRWVDERIAKQPAGEVIVLRPFAEWRMLRRLRRRSAVTGATSFGSAKTVKTRIDVAIRFLAWCREQGLHLAGLRQADLERWLVSQRTTAYEIRHFLRWAAERGFVTHLSVPARQVITPARSMDIDGHHELVRSVLESEQDARARFAGALVVLFSQPVSRVARIRKDDVVFDPDAVTIDLGKEKLVLPDALGAIARAMLTQRRGHLVIGGSAPNEFLFPGGKPGRPISAGALERRLDRLGITDVREARTTAGRQLAARVPARVLADLLNVHINTAISWVSDVSGSHHEYAARRISSERRSGRGRSGVDGSPARRKSAPR
jgi:hypothetical protein